jgi:hypothetical protein
MNEFVIKNGLIVESGTTIITGSLNVTGGITGSFSGSGSYALTASFVQLKTLNGESLLGTGNIEIPVITLTKDLYLNNVLQGTFDSTSDVYVSLKDSSSVDITPTTSSLTSNTLNVTLPTPAPSGVALQYPKPQIYISYRNYDPGWRLQNNGYNYTPPSYPAKYAELDLTAGTGSWYTLKTALTVNGVTSTQRFVDLNGVQGWGLVGNVSLAVLDKLTGVMFTRNYASSAGGGANWIAQFTTAFNYTASINNVTYSDWYLMGVAESNAIFGNYGTLTNWIDPVSGLTILPGGLRDRTCLADSWQNSTTFVCQGYNGVQATVSTLSSVNTNETTNYYLYVHNATNLIS